MATYGFTFNMNSNPSATKMNKFKQVAATSDDALVLDPDIYALIRPFCLPAAGSANVVRKPQTPFSGANYFMDEIRSCPSLSPDQRNVLHVESRKLLFAMMVSS